MLVRYSLIDLLAALLRICVQYNIDLHVTRKRKKRGELMSSCDRDVISFAV